MLGTMRDLTKLAEIKADYETNHIISAFQTLGEATLNLYLKSLPGRVSNHFQEE